MSYTNAYFRNCRHSKVFFCHTQMIISAIADTRNCFGLIYNQPFHQLRIYIDVFGLYTNSYFINCRYIRFFFSSTILIFSHNISYISYHFHTDTDHLDTLFWSSSAWFHWQKQRSVSPWHLHPDQSQIPCASILPSLPEEALLHDCFQE